MSKCSLNSWCLFSARIMWVLRAACSLYSFSYYAHLIMTVLEFRPSVKDFRLPSHQLGEFVVAFCFSLFINIFLASCIHLDLSTPIRTKLGNFVTPRLYVAAVISASWDQAGSPWIPLEFSDEGWGRVAWRLSTRFDAEWNCEGVWVVYNASCSSLILSITLPELSIFGIRFFYMRTCLAYLLTTILGTRCQHCVDSWQKLEPRRYDGMDCLSFHSFVQIYTRRVYSPQNWSKKSLPWMMSQWTAVSD